MKFYGPQGSKYLKVPNFVAESAELQTLYLELKVHISEAALQLINSLSVLIRDSLQKLGSERDFSWIWNLLFRFSKVQILRV